MFGELKNEGESHKQEVQVGLRNDLSYVVLTMEEVQFEFNSFLLQISKELTDRQFQHLKFVLKGSVTSAKCEEMTEVCHYFGELQRLLLLTPTDFGVLKKALNVIERPDLAAKCQEKESYFGDLLRPQIKVGDNLEQRGLLICTFSGRSWPHTAVCA